MLLTIVVWLLNLNSLDIWNTSVGLNSSFESDNTKGGRSISLLRDQFYVNAQN